MPDEFGPGGDGVEESKDRWEEPCNLACLGHLPPNGLLRLDGRFKTHHVRAIARAHNMALDKQRKRASRDPTVALKVSPVQTTVAISSRSASHTILAPRFRSISWLVWRMGMDSSPRSRA